MAYSYYRSVTVDQTKVPSDLTDFPILVSFTNNDLRTVANGGKVQNASGFDIGFFSDSGLASALSWEMESYNGTTGTVIAWVKVPALSGSVDTVLYIAYGDAAIVTFQSTASSVWDANYKSVNHLPDGTTLGVLDSTSNANNGTNSGMIAAAGQIGGCAQRNANASHKLTTGYRPTGIGSVTVSAWVKLALASDGSQYHILADTSSFFQATGLALFCGDSAGYPSTLKFQVSNSASKPTAVATAPTTGVWFYAVGSYDGATVKVYRNGVVGGTTQALTGNTDVLSGLVTFTENFYGASAVNHAIDEIRVSNNARSADWITTEYNNQNSPSTFFTLGSEIPVSSGPVIPVFMARARQMAA